MNARGLMATRESSRGLVTLATTRGMVQRRARSVPRENTARSSSTECTLWRRRIPIGSHHLAHARPDSIHTRALRPARTVQMARTVTKRESSTAASQARAAWRMEVTGTPWLYRAQQDLNAQDLVA